MPSKMKEGFVQKVFDRRAAALEAGEQPPCECWDCLRADGLTPPLHLREQHARRYPNQVLGKDPGGEPEVTTNKSQSEYNAKGVEASHLREAVRNRSAI